MVLFGLMVVVGLASFGVNRFLAQTQQRVLSESIAIIERTERVAQDADFAAALAGQLAAARELRQSEDLARALQLRIDRIAADLEVTRAFLGRAPEPDSATPVRGVVTEMESTVAVLIEATELELTERASLSEAGAMLSALISTEADLARLRVTAGIWELYSLPSGADTRPELDRLTDANFFAYERLAEMAEAVSTFGQLLARVGMAGRNAELDALERDYQAEVALMQDRVTFMLSARSRAMASDIVAELAQGLTVDGVIAQRRSALQAKGALDALSLELGRQLDLLIAEALQGRVETRERMQTAVAASGWQATLLSAALAGVILLALFAGYMVWTRIRRRVVLRLEGVADRMVAMADGDLGQALTISGADEIGRLEAALNILRDRAEEAMTLRGRLEAAVLDRTAEVVAEMQSANAARADAEEQSRAKTHFMARMSHEIRTPLNGLIGLLDLLGADEADAGRRARLEVALTSARDLQELTEEILTFSVGEDGQDQKRLAAFDPTVVAQGLAAHLDVIAAAKGLQAVVRIDPDLPPALVGEPTKIRQVMMNLLSNAVKYTARGSVTLSVGARPIPPGRQELSLCVRDTGPGMTADETRQAFDIYGRSRSARQSGVKGVGLGLAIVRQLTDAMRAELRISTLPGRGSSFTLVLSLPEADPDAISALPPEPAAGAGRRVLVVDDHPVNRLVARGYLERMGCRVTEAATGQAALAAARDGDFDAMLVDLNLPDLSGDAVVSQIVRKGARVAVLTADLVRDDAETRERFGVDRVLTKPISPRALASFLEGGEPLPAAETAPGSVVDVALRDDIAGLGAEQTAEIVAALMADISAAVPLLRDFPDPETRRKLAHRLKGAASNFRLEPFCNLMQRIEAGEPSALETLNSVASNAINELASAARRAGLDLQPFAKPAKT